MKVRRKSNWYIYVITLIISFVLLGFFVRSIWDSLFPTDTGADSAYSVNNADFRPSADIKLNFVVMLSEMKAGTPDYYMLASYTPRSESVVFVPFPENTRMNYKGNTGSLYEMYSNLGAEAVVGAVSETLGFECENYIKFDRLSLIDFVDLTGNVYVNIPVDITRSRIETFLETEMMEVDGEMQEVTKTVKKKVEDIIFPSGAQYFDGETLYSYITYDFGKGDDYMMAVQGAAAMNMINHNFRDLSSTELQSFAEKIINSTETGFMFSDYVKYQPVLQYTTENSINPCEYYIPYGETEGGYFVLNPNSIQTIRDRCGIVSEGEK